MEKVIKEWGRKPKVDGEVKVLKDATGICTPTNYVISCGL